MAFLVAWDDLKKVRRTLEKRLKAAKIRRHDQVEEEWRLARGTVFGDEFSDTAQQQATDGVDTEDFDISERIDVKYAFRNLRLIHSHMSSNPPVATARPDTPDVEDRRAAKSAQQTMRWMLKELDIHNVNDLQNLDVLVCGTGITRTGWDPDAGDLIDFDRKTGEVKMSGALCYRRVPIDNFWPDAECRGEDSLKHTFELEQLTEGQVRSRWPDKWLMIKRRGAHKDLDYSLMTNAIREVAPLEGEQLYDIYYYHEPGSPENAMLGRYVVHLEDGSIVEGPDANPNFHFPPPPPDERRKMRREGVDMPAPGDEDNPESPSPIAYLPYQILTDIDVQDRFWGRSALYYVAPAQRLMANVDSATLEAIKAHGKATLLLPPGAKMPKDAYDNTSITILEMEDEGEPGRGEPKFLQAFGLPPSMPEMRNNMKQGVDDMWGVNENMLGQQSREQSNVGMQYAVNQGAMVRRRLFNKSIRCVRNQYKSLLSLVIQHWTVEHTISVLGKENAYDAVELHGMDVYCGYEIDVEYGTHLPLDPESRRDTLLKYMPIYQQAGVSQKSIVSALGMADLEYVQSLADLSRDRAKEIVDRIVQTGVQQEPASKFQDHEGILAYLLEYVNTADFDSLDQTSKSLIDDHIEMRRQLAAQEKSEASGAGDMAPGGGAAAPGPGGGAGGGSLPQVPPPPVNPVNQVGPAGASGPPPGMASAGPATAAS